jgi:hypothetical protein
MYSFAQRPDTVVFDEPLYAHYLSHTTTKANHPGTTDILLSQNPDGEAVIRDVILAEHRRPVALFKQMTHHLIALDKEFLAKTDNVLLIRDPKAIISSYAKVIPNPTIQDVGIAQQTHLLRELKKLGTLRAVVDTNDLLKDPAGMLQALCAALDIPFYEKMLRWPAGPRPEDGVWATYWYTNVHKSTGFKPYTPRTYSLTGSLADLADACQPYYDELYREALQPVS